MAIRLARKEQEITIAPPVESVPHVILGYYAGNAVK